MVFCHMWCMWYVSEVTYKCIVQYIHIYHTSVSVCSLLFLLVLIGWLVLLLFDGFMVFFLFFCLSVDKRVLGIELQKLYIIFYGCYTHIYIHIFIIDTIYIYNTCLEKKVVVVVGVIHKKTVVASAYRTDTYTHTHASERAHARGWARDHHRFKTHTAIRWIGITYHHATC